MTDPLGWPDGTVYDLPMECQAPRFPWNTGSLMATCSHHFTYRCDDITGFDPHGAVECPHCHQLGGMLCGVGKAISPERVIGRRIGQPSCT